MSRFNIIIPTDGQPTIEPHDEEQQDTSWLRDLGPHKFPVISTNQPHPHKIQHHQRGMIEQTAKLPREYFQYPHANPPSNPPKKPVGITFI